MSHTAYWITPDDVAVYLFLENTSHQRENEILWDLFENHKAHIPTEYGSTYLQFKQSVMNLLNIYELDAVSYDEAKNCNFGVFYGLFPKGLQTTLRFKAGLDTPIERCQEIIRNLKAGYSGLTLWQDETKRCAAQTCYAETGYDALQDI